MREGNEPRQNWLDSLEIGLVPVQNETQIHFNALHFRRDVNGPSSEIAENNAEEVVQKRSHWGEIPHPTSEIFQNCQYTFGGRRL